MIRFLRSLASLKLTLAGMVGFAVGVIVYRGDISHTQWWVAAPLLLLAFNLLAAIVTNPRFRYQPGLLLFHICLLLIAGLAAVDKLIAFEGTVEIVAGTAFAADQVRHLRRGPWHRTQLHQVEFTQGDLRVEYVDGLRRGRTSSTLWLPRTPGAIERIQVGDKRPLIAAGYRFYTTSNKGYAALLTWRDRNGVALTGSINFPSYPLNDWKQNNQWIMPNGASLDISLLVAPQAYARRTAWTLDDETTPGRIRVRHAGAERVLAPGERIAIAGGSIQFEEARMWMGYRIVYVPLLPWLLVTALTGVLGLTWHLWGKFGRAAPRAATAGMEASPTNA